LAPEKAILCLRMLLEGNSVRSTERLTGVHRDTIISLMVALGERCQSFLSRTIKDMPIDDVEADEIWAFVGCKEKTRLRHGYSEEVGDAYCFIGIERTTKLVLAWHLGKRTPESTLYFAVKLRDVTGGRFQLSTDGFTPYRHIVPLVFNNSIDFAQLVKVYGTSAEGEHRYSPATIIDTHQLAIMGRPDEDRVCSSHAERSNLTMRMSIRRLTRLTNAHSKKWENHEAALALYFAYYNYCRPHATLTEYMGYKCSPAMKAGLAEHVWSVGDLLIGATRS
jgi:IS1 family transposase